MWFSDEGVVVPLGVCCWLLGELCFFSFFGVLGIGLLCTTGTGLLLAGFNFDMERGGGGGGGG